MIFEGCRIANWSILETKGKLNIETLEMEEED